MELFLDTPLGANRNTTFGVSCEDGSARISVLTWGDNDDAAAEEPRVERISARAEEHEGDGVHDGADERGGEAGSWSRA